MEVVKYINENTGEKKIMWTKKVKISEINLKWRSGKKKVGQKELKDR